MLVSRSSRENFLGKQNRKATVSQGYLYSKQELPLSGSKHVPGPRPQTGLAQGHQLPG